MNGWSLFVGFTNISIGEVHLPWKRKVNYIHQSYLLTCNWWQSRLWRWGHWVSWWRDSFSAFIPTSVSSWVGEGRLVGLEPSFQQSLNPVWMKKISTLKFSLGSSWSKSSHHSLPNKQRLTVTASPRACFSLRSPLMRQARAESCPGHGLTTFVFLIHNDAICCLVRVIPSERLWWWLLTLTQDTDQLTAGLTQSNEHQFE